MKFRLISALTFAALAVATLNAQRTPETQFKAAQQKELVEGDIKGALKEYEKLAKGKDRTLAAQALLRMAECYQKLGEGDADKVYQRLIRDFADQTAAVSVARTRLRSPGGSNTEVHERRIYSGSNFDHGFPSADGRFYAYGDRALYVVNTATRETRLVVPAPLPTEWNGYPSVSPNGKQLVYARFSFAGNDGAIRLVNMDGSNDRVLFAEKGVEGLPTDWSADGQYIAATLYRESSVEVALISVANANKKSLYSTQQRSGFGGTSDILKFSPDGRFLAFTERGDVRVVPVAGGPAVSAVENPAVEQLSGWAPDGSLIFSSDRSGSADLWAIAMRDGKPTGEPRMVKKNAGRGLGITRQGSYFYSIGQSLRTVRTTELDAAGQTKGDPTILGGRFTGLNGMPAYSPDGRFLAYVSGAPDRLPYEIRLVTLQTGQERVLPRPEGRQVAQIGWFPDSSALFMLAGNGRFYRVDVQTGAGSQLTSEAIPQTAISYGVFSPDGKSIYYRNQNSIVRLDLATNTSQNIYKPTDTFLRMFSLSPDGSQMVLYNRTGESDDALYVMPSAGGAVRRIHDYPRGEMGRSPGALAWTADGKSILFHHGVGGQDEVLRIPLDGGAPQRLLTTDHIWSLTVHPDGRHLAWESRSSTAEVFVVDNLFARPK